MMEEIKFTDGNAEISFFGSSAVPRQGEFVSAKGEGGVHIEGRVRSVRWYYSDDGKGPLALVHLE